MESTKQNRIGLNLGCGRKKLDGYINVDKDPTIVPDMLLDFDKEDVFLPFKSSVFTDVSAHHILEHVANFIPLMTELHRICVPKARIEIIVPHYKHKGAFSDPTHVRFFTEDSFKYFDEWRWLYNLPYFTILLVNIEDGGEQMHVILEVVK